MSVGLQAALTASGPASAISVNITVPWRAASVPPSHGRAATAVRHKGVELTGTFGRNFATILRATCDAITDSDISYHDTTAHFRLYLHPYELIQDRVTIISSYRRTQVAAAPPCATNMHP